MKPKKHFSKNDLEQISRKLEKFQKQGKKILDNVDFMNLLNISRNTSTNWRNSKKIKFSRVGRRVFFRFKDIEKMMEEHREN